MIDHWHRIEAVAAALLIERTLTVEQVWSIAAEAPDNGPYYDALFCIGPPPQAITVPKLPGKEAR